MIFSSGLYFFTCNASTYEMFLDLFKSWKKSIKMGSIEINKIGFSTSTSINPLKDYDFLFPKYNEWDSILHPSKTHFTALGMERDLYWC